MVKQVLRFGHYAYRTEQSYSNWRVTLFFGCYIRKVRNNFVIDEYTLYMYKVLVMEDNND